MGYPQHATWAVGAWSHAASEALRAFPELAMRLRDCRLQFERCLARVLLGESPAKVFKDMPDMETLSMDIHEMILAELLASKQGQAGQEGVRSVWDALGMQK